jgi:prepilin-type N-terminal cleavage/methylation domain-containing protein
MEPKNGPKMNKILASQSGFTIIEVLVSSGIFAIALFFILSISSNNLNSLAYDETRVIATQVASNVMEDLLLRSSSDPVLTGVQPQSESFNASGQQITTGGIYTATWTVTPGTPIANIIQIQLVVTWAVAGVAKKISLLSFRSSQ